ncbi:MAG TPA: PH domain-containing protein [Microbacteriaceae bacterium]|nr:PH domain-containing protein [Microbacteriaceae bacterium]
MRETETETELDVAIFDRHDPAWRRVSSKYAVVDLIMNLFFAIALGGVVAFIIVVSQNNAVPFAAYAPAAVSTILFINSFFSFRRVRAIGYILRDDDLIFRRGIMFERIVAVPYGRLQLVDISRGPLMRALGLATLKFVTASQSSGVNLPGLTLAEAETLRDELINLAETRRSGL